MKPHPCSPLDGLCPHSRYWDEDDELYLNTRAPLPELRALLVDLEAAAQGSDAEAIELVRHVVSVREKQQLREATLMRELGLDT